MIKKIFKILDRQDKLFFPVMLVMVLLFSLLEMLGVSLLFGFCQFFMNSEKLNMNGWINHILTYLPGKTTSETMVYFTLLLFVVYFGKAIYGVFFTYTQLKYSRRICLKLVRKMFSNMMLQPYLKFIKSNTADYTKALLQEVNNTAAIVPDVLTMLAEGMTVILLLTVLLITDFKMTIWIGLFFGGCFFIFSRIMTVRFNNLGCKKTELLGQVYRAINEAFGNIKVLKLNCHEEFGLKKYMQAAEPYNQVQVSYGTMQVLPRNIIELLGFTAFMIVVLVSMSQGKVAEVFPLLTLFAISFYRIMPSISRMMTMYNEINYYRPSIEIVSNYLSISDIDGKHEEECSFKKGFSLREATFYYENKHLILNQVDLYVAKGAKIGFVGESGVGKSTLIDILSGLIMLTSGQLEIDGIALTQKNCRAWRKKIGYIPQNIYLFEGTVAENVCLGSLYDEELIQQALKQANIWDFLKTKQGINTMVGEGGVNLSGGQKQRIAIARALYQNPEVLILDEATSALDVQTEEKIIQEIFEAGRDKTMLIISHRPSILQECDFIYKLHAGKIVNQSFPTQV